MTVARSLHARSRELFLAACAEPAEDRLTFLRKACSGDESLFEEVASLLAHDDERWSTAFHTGAGVEAVDLDAADPLIGATIGRYRIERVIAAGGMGVVYEARQEAPERMVALKVMRAGLATPAARRRFATEAQFLARLRHPGVAQVYDAGVHRDALGEVAYFAMEFVEGAQTLTPHCAQRGLDRTARLELFAQICDAAHHGHQRGVMHRDLKPGNVLVDEAGQPKIIDFGVARLTDSDITVTAASSVDFVGTLPYMSPEQCAGDPRAIDTRTDVYSLGVMLFELLTGELPFDLRDAPVTRAIRMISEAPPRRPSAMDRSLRGDLETIVLKAMAKAPEARYESAAALAEDVRRHLRHEPIAARPVGALRQLTLFARRHKATAWATAAVVLALVAATGVSAAFAVKEAAARRRAEFETYVASLAAASADIAAGNIGSAQQRLADIDPRFHSTWEWRHLASRVDESLLTLRGHEAEVRSIAFDPAGELAASGAHDGEHRIWRVADGALMASFEPNIVPYCMEFASDDLLIITGEQISSPGVGVVSWWDVTDAREPRRVGDQLRLSTGAIGGSAVRRDGLIAVSSRTGLISLAQFHSGGARVLAQWPAHAGNISAVSFSPDASRLASASWDMTVKVWDVRDPVRPVLVATGTHHTDFVNDVVYSPRGDLIASGCVDGTIALWRPPPASSSADAPRKLELLESFQGAKRGLKSLDISPSGDRLIAGGGGQTLRLWGLEEQRESWDRPNDSPVWQIRAVRERRLLGELRGHRSGIYDVVFHPDGARAASVSMDGTVRIWNAASAPGMPTLTGHRSSVGGVAFSPDGRFVASAGGEGWALIWDVATASRAASLYSHSGALSSIAWSAQDVLAASSEEGDVALWDMRDVASPKRVVASRDPLAHESSVSALAFSRDGRRLATGDIQGGALLWSVDRNDRGTWSIDLERHFPAQGLSVRSLSFSPDGESLAVGFGGDPRSNPQSRGMVRVWRLADHAREDVFKAFPASVHAVLFHPSGRTLFVVCGDGGVRLLRSRSGALMRTLDRYSAPILAATISPQGDRIAASAANGTIHLWDVGSGRRVATLATHVGAVSGLAISPDGSRLASASGGVDGVDNAVCLWERDASLEMRLQRARRSTARRRAAPVVAALGRELLLSERIAAAIESDDSLTPQIREAALDLARAVGDNPQRLDAQAWAIASQADRPVADYRLALAAAERALHMIPSNSIYRDGPLFAYGAAAYRLGRFEEALAALTDARRIRSQRGRSDHSAILALLVLIHHAMGNDAAARDYWRGLRETGAESAGLDAATKGLIREAATAIDRIEENASVSLRPSTPDAQAEETA